MFRCSFLSKYTCARYHELFLSTTTHTHTRLELPLNKHITSDLRRKKKNVWFFACFGSCSFTSKRTCFTYINMLFFRSVISFKPLLHEKWLLEYYRWHVKYFKICQIKVVCVFTEIFGLNSSLSVRRVPCYDGMNNRKRGYNEKKKLENAWV